jgi:hypothetical protein
LNASQFTAANNQQLNGTIQLARVLLQFRAVREAVSQLPNRNISDIPTNLQSNFAGNDKGDLARLLLDAWGNPVVYVPDGFQLFDPVTSQASTVTVLGGISGLSTTLGAPISATQFRSPDRRGFFMSAGPDRNYATYDDNIFSFNE